MSRLRVRWAEGPNDRPMDEEALARLERIGPFRRESHPGQGLPHPVTGKPTDLVLAHFRTRFSVETNDGRRLKATFDPNRDAPQIDSDAPADLRDALNRAWLAKGRPGRSPEQQERVEAIIQAAQELRGGATRARIARAVGGLTKGGEEHGQFKDDMRAIGGMDEVKRRAGI